MPSRLLAILPLILLTTHVGCDRTDSGKPQPAQAATTGPVRTGTGIIQGTVTLAGGAPVMHEIPNQFCHPGAKPVTEETVLVDAAGGMRNVVVFLEGAPPAPAGSAPPVVLDQVECRYVPHVLAIRTGQTLHVTTSDPTLHNVHGLCAVNDAFNFALVRAGQSKDMTFNAAETFPIRCDVHPWMRAWAHVFAHPYFAVTGADGSFQIVNIPDGSYTLVARHEKYGDLRQPVSVSDGKLTPASFRFQSGL